MNENKQRCEECQNQRTTGTDGLCHQCRVELRERDIVIIDDEDEKPIGWNE